MGMDIDTKKGPLRFTNACWREILGLAFTHYGWKPEGTKLIDPCTGEPSESEGSYLFNDWQLMTESDCAALLTALDQALKDPKGWQHRPHFSDGGSWIPWLTEPMQELVDHLSEGGGLTIM